MFPSKVQSVILENLGSRRPVGGARDGRNAIYSAYTGGHGRDAHDAIGVWYDEFPLTPERVLWGIQASASD